MALALAWTLTTASAGRADTIVGLTITGTVASDAAAGFTAIDSANLFGAARGSLVGDAIRVTTSYDLTSLLASSGATSTYALSPNSVLTTVTINGVSFSTSSLNFGELVVPTAATNQIGIYSFDGNGAVGNYIELFANQNGLPGFQVSSGVITDPLLPLNDFTYQGGSIPVPTGTPANYYAGLFINNADYLLLQNYTVAETINGVAVSSSSAPEPSTWLLLATGIALVVLPSRIRTALRRE
jgi:hypothetical protein